MSRNGAPQEATDKVLAQANFRGDPILRGHRWWRLSRGQPWNQRRGAPVHLATRWERSRSDAGEGGSVRPHPPLRADARSSRGQALSHVVDVVYGLARPQRVTTAQRMHQCDRLIPGAGSNDVLPRIVVMPGLRPMSVKIRPPSARKWRSSRALTVMPGRDPGISRGNGAGRDARIRSGHDGLGASPSRFGSYLNAHGAKARHDAVGIAPGTDTSRPPW